jgi:pseudouridylate synthase
MKHEISPQFLLSDIVYEALSAREPVVALESTVITHGLPYPQNRLLAEDMEAEVSRLGVIPATIAVLDGQVHVGIDPAMIERLARSKDMHKVTTRDLAAASVSGWSGGTTVAATMYAAYLSGIRVFATGGIGGVHRLAVDPPGAKRLAPFQQNWDVSADLPQLANTPMIVVCAGAKAILDINATLEYLETSAVPVLGFESDDFPAFYSRSSGLKVSKRVDSAQEIVAVARAHWGLGLRSAVLVANPPPIEASLPFDEVESAVNKALRAAAQDKISGQQVTPYLLSRMSELTHGSSIDANLALLKNNARLAARIAIELAK